jgi:sortase B
MAEAEKKNKKKKKGDLLFKVIILVLLCVICVSLYKVGTILWEYHQGTQQYKTVEKVAKTEHNSDHVDFAALSKNYKNVRAWLYNKGTVINYPVVKGKDNSFYLHHMVNGEYNWKGTLFIDYRNKKPFDDFVTVIYGHRMKDGSMFHSLIEYRDHDYYLQHPKMLLTTPSAKYDVVVFAAVTIPAASDKYKFDFSSSAEKQTYINWIESKTELKTDVKVTTSDKLLMMSTCTYEFDEARLVVFGKLVKKG